MVRGRREPQVSMLAFVDLEARVPLDHLLRTIKAVADKALAGLSGEFGRMYATVGRPSIPPGRLLKASLLTTLYSVRSEQALCEELVGCWRSMESESAWMGREATATTCLSRGCGGR